MDPPAGDLRHGVCDELLRNAPHRSCPRGFVGTIHSYGDMQVCMPLPQVLELLAEDDVLRSTCPVKEEDIPGKGAVGEIACDAHHGSDPHATADQDDTVGFRAGEGKHAGGARHLQVISDRHVVMQIAGFRALIFPFYGELDVVALRWRRGDRIGTPDALAIDLCGEDQELAGHEGEGDGSAPQFSEPERLDVRSFVEDVGDAQCTRPGH